MHRISTIGRHLSPGTPHKPPIKVTVTGAAGNIGYAIVFMIGQGRMFGPEQPIDLTLLEIPQVAKVLEGTVMELNDCAFDLLKSVKGVTNNKDAFTGCQVAVLIGAKPRGPGMERKDLLGQNAMIFKEQGQALNEFADKKVKVVVVGNPANTNAMICSHFAPNIPKTNFTALTRLDQNRAVFQVAQKLATNNRNVSNIIIWGNHSSTQVPDLRFGLVQNLPTDLITTSARSQIGCEKYVQGEFATTVAQRGAAIIKQREKSSAASAANAVCDHVHDWIVGTLPGQFVSMAVMTDGSYGIPEGICFGFPVQCFESQYTIVKGLVWDEDTKKKIDATLKELLEEKQMALDYLNSKAK